MPPSCVNFSRHFLPWDGPWLPQAAVWLARGWGGAAPLDLSRGLVVVPTRQAGRRLREALAEHAAGRGSAVFPPRTYTPDTLLQLGAAADVATRLEARLAWTEVLREIDPAEVPEVLPVAPPRRDFAWAWRLAESLDRLQTQLTEGGLGFAEVAAGGDFPEVGRWRQLAELERRQQASLARRGRREPHAARRAWVREAAPPSGIEWIAILGVPDPLPLALDLLARWSVVLPVDVVVFAPEKEAESFDAVGRPRVEAWGQREIALPDFERRVHLCADPAAEAAHATALVRRHAVPDGAVALGVADAEVLPRLEHELTRAGVLAYNPEGTARRAGALCGLLQALAAVAREPTAEAVATLVRCPEFLGALGNRSGPDFSVARFLADFDALRQRHLPADLAGLRRAVRSTEPALAAGLAWVDELRAVVAEGEFLASATEALLALQGERRFDLGQADGARAAAAVTAWREVIRECAAAGNYRGVTAADWWKVALQALGESRQTEEKPAGAIELQGWLELAWEDAPHLVIAGLNDGLVPDAVVGDAFLPESLRVRLGLKTNAARFGRDAYLLQAIAASRREAGRLDVLLAKVSAAGDPLRPSRLLLACRDGELPARIRWLFRPVEAARSAPAWTRAWQLAPPRLPALARVAVTGLRAWLACPFRFYLQHGLRLEALDPAKNELDARDFGTLCHGALEAMAREPALRTCTDEKVLRDFLWEQLERVARERFGARLSLPLVVQLESARQRLGRAAVVQAREQAAGWVIERVEWPFTLDLGGLEVRGKIDRVDRHAGTGAWRVLDYKTSDTAVPPAKSHLRPRRTADDGRPGWMAVGVDGRDCIWTDLQLPLYVRALAGEATGATSLECGYFNLPKAAGETAIAPWPDLAGGLQAAAEACADGVAAAIRAGEFWPPAEVPADRDPFAALFHHGAAASVAWEESR